MSFLENANTSLTTNEEQQALAGYVTSVRTLHALSTIKNRIKIQGNPAHGSDSGVLGKEYPRRQTKPFAQRSNLPDVEFALAP